MSAYTEAGRLTEPYQRGEIDLDPEDMAGGV